jgi:hypothetical protein
MLNPNLESEKRKSENTQKLRELLKEFKVTSKEILVEYNEPRDPSQIQIVYQNIFQRLYIGLSSIDILLGHFVRNQYFKYPLALQMRACLLDSIIIVYLLVSRIKSEDEFRLQLARLNLDVAKEIYKENIGKDIIELKRQILYYGLETNFSNEKDVIILNKLVKRIQNRGMAQALEGTDYEWFSPAYKLYSYYSKYEHFGTVGKVFLEFPPEFDFDNLVESIFHVFCAAYIASDIMKVSNSLSEKIKLLRDQVRKIESVFDPKVYNRGV